MQSGRSDQHQNGNSLLWPTEGLMQDHFLGLREIIPKILLFLFLMGLPIILPRKHYQRVGRLSM